MKKALVIVTVTLSLLSSAFSKPLAELTEADLAFPAKVLLDLAKTEQGEADHISGISISEDDDGLYSVYGLCHGYSYQGDLMGEWYIFAQISKDLKLVLGRGYRYRWSHTHGFKPASGPVKMEFPIKVQDRDVEKLIRKRLWDYIQGEKEPTIKNK
jgi:hypothetical protein